MKQRIWGSTKAQYSRKRVEPTNILLIVLDDIGLDALPIYDAGKGPLPRLPNLQQLTSEGLKFQFAYGNPACSPTRATIQTGRYGLFTGVTDNDTSLGLDELILPEMLDSGNAGYRHAAFGKWHLGGGDPGPNQAGYSHFAGSLANLGDDGKSYYSWRKVVNGAASTSTCYATTENINDALDWIASSTQRWFCHLALNAAHTPYHRPPRRLHHIELPEKFESLRQEQLMLFHAAIEAADTEIGRMLGSIDMEETTVILIGDNGTAGQVIQAPFGRERDKLTIYEGGVRVPLIVRGPLVNQPGREVSALVNTTDIFATIAELAGVRLDQLDLPTLHSISLLPYMLRPQQPPQREFVFFERRRLPLDEDPVEWRAIRDSRYKLIVDPRLGEIIYDLLEDPLEQGDGRKPMFLAGDPKRAYLRLHRALEQLLMSTKDLLPARAPPSQPVSRRKKSSSRLTKKKKSPAP